jgi:DNA-binding transcriptional LysR family regulator
VELRHLTAFVAVADEASFTRAAGRLHIVQSAVSAAVRNLEKELGSVLFERSSQGVTLSEAGRALLPEARSTLAAAAAAR